MTDWINKNKIINGANYIEFKYLNNYIRTNSKVLFQLRNVWSKLLQKKKKIIICQLIRI